ncbi:proteinase [Intrasporangium oryzae NRRL B-24470]|uniref:Proteinase n=1 Tax=Intrasporangium oryzae NRRL B-24470 TaxID=1386089 RepID=W9GEG6_9MICO|nr:alpha/beta hydrolase [Intrasporangium oryzae]EWT03607.1 proteinase [Intrasporangium oryzae NRRL B-24470]
MLNDAPRPEDLPELPDGPERAAELAALFGARRRGRTPSGPGGPGAPHPSTASDVTASDVTASLTASLRASLKAEPQMAASRGGRPASRRSRGLTVVAAVTALALLALTALTFWGLGGRSTQTAESTRVPTGSGAPSASPGKGATSSPSPSAGAPASLEAYYAQKVAWSPCPDNPRHECGTLEVPVDYAKPDGDRFTVAMRKVPALDPSKRLGSILVNPGGPGGSGVQYAQYAAYAFSKAVRESYDIVGFDPRGIGASDRVGCLTDSDMDLLFSDDPTPDTAAERTKLIADADAVTEHCAARGGQRALHMSTTEVARDMDVMRALLGDDRLNFFGGSYGTFLGAIYADLFPKKVGRFVLDSAMSPNQTDEQEMTYDIQGFESSIDAFIAWCVSQPTCSLGHDKAAAKGRIVDLLDQVERHGLKTSKPGLATIGEGWVNFAIFMCLYSDSYWPTLNRGLAQAMTGRGDILLARGMAVVERNAAGHYADSSYLPAMIPVRCADWPRMSSSASLRAAQRKAQADHPLWARMTGELYDNCAKWPAPGRTPKGSTLAVGAAPILVIGNLRDPATPIGGTKQLAKDLDSGILVTSDHDGHGTYYSGNSCVDSVVDDYLIRGTVPRNGTSC